MGEQHNTRVDVFITLWEDVCIVTNAHGVMTHLVTQTNHKDFVVIKGSEIFK